PSKGAFSIRTGVQCAAGRVDGERPDGVVVTQGRKTIPAWRVRSPLKNAVVGAGIERTRLGVDCKRPDPGVRKTGNIQFMPVPAGFGIVRVVDSLDVYTGVNDL